MANPPVRLTLHGSTLTLRADEASLYDILQAFVEYGIRVEAQTGIQTRFNDHLNDVSIDEALDQLLEGHNHNTSWREIPYGSGAIRMLSAIQVYAPQGLLSGAMQPIPPATPRILRLTTGEAYLADELLIGIRPGTDADHLRRLLSNMGGHVVSVNPETGIYRIRLPQNTNLPALLDQLADQGAIAIAEPNFVFPALPPQGREEISATSPVSPPKIRPPAPGHPALAILDSGLDPTRLPDDVLRASLDVTGENRPLQDPVGHGTHMALIAAGLSGTPGQSATGQAVPLISIRGFDPEGNTHTFGILEGLNFAAEQGARVISMSWGAYTESQILAHAFQQASDQGMILLASAGNDGQSRLMYPAAYPSVLAVGAANASGDRAPYSNYGPGLDLFAPGTAILTNSATQTQTHLHGTSMATPWVAAAITAYLHQNPEASPAEVLERLNASLNHNQNDDKNTPGRFDEQARARFLTEGIND